MIVTDKSQELIRDAVYGALDAEALIKEARQRQRKRRLFITILTHADDGVRSRPVS